jgi:hypothetical protein
VLKIDRMPDFVGRAVPHSTGIKLAVFWEQITDAKSVHIIDAKSAEHRRPGTTATSPLWSVGGKFADDDIDVITGAGSRGLSGDVHIKWRVILGYGSPDGDDLSALLIAEFSGGV